MAKQLLSRFNSTTFILIGLLLFGLFLRTVDINHNPNGIYGDGLTLVYDSYSILKTGHDQKGNFLPFIFELGDHRPPGYVYATVPFTAIFGPNAYSAYSVSILSGLGIIVLLFLLGRYFFSTRVGLLAATFAVISPWEISLSRGPFETHFALFLSLLGIYCYFKSKLSPKWLVFAALSFLLSSITYPTYPLTNPILIGLVVLVDKTYHNFFARYKVYGFVTIAILLVSLSLSVFILHGNNGPSRVESINIFNQHDTSAAIVQAIDSDRMLDTVPSQISPLLHNRFWSYFTLIFENYIENFRPGFLLIQGDAQPVHNPASNGEIYWATFFLIFGGIILLYGRKNQTLFLLLGWILIGPIATAFVGPPHALRDSLMLPPLLLLMGFGAEKLLASKRPVKKYILGFLLILLTIEFVFFVDDLYFIAPNKYARFWSYPAKEASIMALADKSKYNYIIMDATIDNMEFAYPVYADLDPHRVIEQNEQGTMLQGYRFLNYDNVYIGTIPPVDIKSFMNQLPGSVLYIGSPDDKSYVDVNNILQTPDGLPDLVISQKN